jgi:hypothetical protein
MRAIERIGVSSFGSQVCDALGLMCDLDHWKLEPQLIDRTRFICDIGVTNCAHRRIALFAPGSIERFFGGWLNDANRQRQLV